MGKLKNNQKGFTAVEGLLIVLILVVIGAVGYMVYHNDHKAKTTTSISTTAASKPPVKTTPTTSQYPKYTTISTLPSGWSTYTNSTYNFSIDYPSTWTQANTSKSSTTYASDSSINFFDIHFNNPAAPGSNTITYDYGVQVTNQSLSQNLTADENSLVNNNNGNGSAVSAKIVDTKNYTFNGDNAVQLDVAITDKNAGTTSYNVDFIVYANGYSYDFYSQNNDSNGVLSDTTVSTALSTLSIK